MYTCSNRPRAREEREEKRDIERERARQRENESARAREREREKEKERERPRLRAIPCVLDRIRRFPTKEPSRCFSMLTLTRASSPKMLFAYRFAAKNPQSPVHMHGHNRVRSAPERDREREARGDRGEKGERGAMERGIGVGAGKRREEERENEANVKGRQRSRDVPLAPRQRGTEKRRAERRGGGRPESSSMWFWGGFGV